MYALAICGSPRQNGNTSIILNEILDVLKKSGWETEMETVGGKDIKGCKACNACFKKADGSCIIHALKGKIGVGVSAVRRGGATHAVDTINHLFMITRMIIPGSTYWNMVYGLRKGDVLQDEEGINNMRHIGKAINWLGKAIKPHMHEYPINVD